MQLTTNIESKAHIIHITNEDMKFGLGPDFRVVLPGCLGRPVLQESHARFWESFPSHLRVSKTCVEHVALDPVPHF